MIKDSQKLDKPKLNVLFDARVPDGEHGGIRTYSQLLIETALKINEVEVFALSTKDSSWINELLPESRVIRIGVDARSAYQKLKSFPYLADIARTIFYLLQLNPPKLSKNELGRDFDVFHTAIQDAPVVPAKLVYHPHDLQHLVIPKNFDFATRVHRSRIWRNLARKASVVVVGSRSIADEISKYWPECSGKVQVIPVPPPSLKISKRIKPSFVDSILYIAGLYPHKNQETLIRAYSQLSIQAKVSHPLVLLGGGPDYERLSRLIESLGESKNITLTGKVSQDSYLALLTSCSIVCVPSKYEAGSFPILEALVSAIPVVASDIPAFKDFLPGCIEYYGEPEDVNGLRNALQKIIDEGSSVKSRELVKNYLKLIDSEAFGASLRRIYLSL
jgi:glycosyltransferase involved in cell wall biosynthesis